eukprot:scaffold710_cov171-Amphora_coffeaeformis.AAC.26
MSPHRHGDEVRLSVTARLSVHLSSSITRLVSRYTIKLRSCAAYQSREQLISSVAPSWEKKLSSCCARSTGKAPLKCCADGLELCKSLAYVGGKRIDMKEDMVLWYHTLRTARPSFSKTALFSLWKKERIASIGSCLGRRQEANRGWESTQKPIESFSAKFRITEVPFFMSADFVKLTSQLTTRVKKPRVNLLFRTTRTEELNNEQARHRRSIKQSNTRTTTATTTDISHSNSSTSLVSPSQRELTRQYQDHPSFSGYNNAQAPQRIPYTKPRSRVCFDAAISPRASVVPTTTRPYKVHNKQPKVTWNPTKNISNTPKTVLLHQ